jgi:UDP-GlcNAc:undecaprenyl-phosphate/decaprenyl-phosphate GlcNAc-1-phosphate transferase
VTAYLLVGALAAVVTFVLTPVVRWLSLKIGAVDQPGDRKVHARPTPTLGGFAILIGIFVAVGASMLLPAHNGVDFKELLTQSSQPLGIAAGAFVIFALGAVDDLRALPAPVKLAGQVFAAGILFLSGVKMQILLLPGGAASLGDDVAVLVTVVWIVAMVNAVNLVDGLDGLAAGIVAIAAAAFFVYTYQLNQASGDFATAAPVICIAIVGACLGFLRHNFHPARIFMGDSGSMLLGLVLGAATVVGVGNPSPVLQNSTSEVFLAYFPLLIPLAVVAIPILDALFAIVRRARRRRSVFHADKEHIHHRLMDLGHGHRAAVVVMYVWSALAAGAGLGFTFLDSSDVIFALPIAVGALVLYTLFPMLTKAVQDRLHP